eukprot:gene14803-2866_t
MLIIHTIISLRAAAALLNRLSVPVRGSLRTGPHLDRGPGQRVATWAHDAFAGGEFIA